VRRIQCTPLPAALKSLGEVVVSEEVLAKQKQISSVIKERCGAYIKTLANDSVVGPEQTSANMGKTKWVCRDKVWVKNSQFLFALLYRFVQDLNVNFGVSVILKKTNSSKKKLEALKRICNNLQLGNHPALDSDKAYAKASESWLPFLYKGSQFVDLMLFLEEWMGCFTTTKVVSAEHMELVKAALERKDAGYTKAEKDTISIAFITIANWD
jgi:hypothetical protein